MKLVFFESRLFDNLQTEITAKVIFVQITYSRIFSSVLSKTIQFQKNGMFFA